MTIDKSLKIKAGSVKQRNVLTRVERLNKLIETERWQEGDPVTGLPKVRVQKISLKKKIYDCLQVITTREAYRATRRALL